MSGPALQRIWDLQRDVQLEDEVNKMGARSYVPACGVGLQVQPCPPVLNPSFSGYPHLSPLWRGSYDSGS
jgi:hypothetical protein